MGEEGTTIPKDRWAEVLREFTDRHLEEFLNVRLVGGEIGDQTISGEGLPFQGVAFEKRSGMVRVFFGQEAVRDPDSAAHEIEAEEIVLVRGDDAGEETLIVLGGGEKMIIEAKAQERKLLAEN
jgi:hypothetical protein